MPVQKKFVWLLFVFLLLAAAGCGAPGQGPVPSPPGQKKLMDASGKALTRDEFLERARKAEYILVGESHSNACDHRVQARLIRWLADNGTGFAVGLEMVPARKQEALDSFNSGETGIKGLADALGWEKIWGHPFSLYRPVFREARRADVSLYGLNVDKELLDTLRDKGIQGLDPCRRQRLPPRIIPPPKEQESSLEEELHRHQRLLKPKNGTELTRERFFRSQAVWDSAMAAQARAIRSDTGLPVLILTGSGHVEYDWGIAHRLKAEGGSPEILSILPWRGLRRPDPDRADLFYYCPVTHTSRLGFSLRLLPRGGRITKVEKGSRAHKAGIRKADLLTTAGGEPFRELMDLHRAAIRAKQGEQPLRLGLSRNGTRKEVELPLRDGSGAAEKPQHPQRKSKP